jgi:hypothetical protein
MDMLRAPLLVIGPLQSDLANGARRLNYLQDVSMSQNI